MVKKLCLLTLILLSTSLTYSQKQLDFDALSIVDGFTSSKAISMLQDKKGFIWIGTWNGLNRYDGYQCEIFKPQHHNSASLSNKEITALAEDRDGNIWIGTSNGLNRFAPESGILTNYPFTSRILDIYIDSNNDAWIGTWGDGLYKLNPVTGKSEHYFPKENINDIHEDKQGEFWIASHSGLINFNRHTGSFTPYQPDPLNRDASISSPLTTQIAETPDGTLWVGTWEGGLNKVIKSNDKRQIKFAHYTPSKLSHSLASVDAYKVISDQYGNLWIGNWNKGLSLLTPDEQKKPPLAARFVNYISDLSNPYSLSGNNITALLVDKSGMLWVGSSKIDRAYVLSTGLDRNITQKPISNIYDASVVRALGGDGKSRLWVGTTDMLKLFEKRGGRYELSNEINELSYTFNGRRFKSASVLDVLDHPTGIWIGTDEAGLIHIPANTSFKTNKPNFKFWNDQTTERIPGNKVGVIVASTKNPNTFWIGTMYNGLAKCQYSNGSLNISTYVAGDNADNLSDNSIRAIAEDNDGFVWVATGKGLDRIDPSGNTITKFHYDPADSSTINDNIINVLHVDGKGNLWIGTSSGLNKKEQKLVDGKLTFTFKSYPNLNYLNNDLVVNITEDKEGKLWIGFYSGMVEFDPTDEEVKREFFVKDYQRLGYERNTSFADDEGNIFMGGQNGFLSFHPNKLSKQSAPPKVVVTDFLIYNKKVTQSDVSGGRPILSKALPYEDQITLAFKDDVLTFVFSAMDFKDPLKNKYAYFMEGFDRKWNEAGTRNSATYTGLPHGEYIFKVKACNGDGIWSEQPTEIKLTVLPPWWQTWIAYILYGAIMVALLYFFRQYSIRQLTQRNQLAMERLNYEKEHELNETKSQFFTNITHEFRTPLTLILGPTKELLEMKDAPPAVNKQALLIQKSAQRLLRLVNQLMEFRKVENDKVQLALQPTNVVPLIVEDFESFVAMAAARNMTYTLDKQVDNLIASIDVDKFDKVVFNLLSNAFKFTDDGGKVTLRIGILPSNNDRFFVEVEDNGIGIDKDKKELVFNRFYQVNDKKSQSTGGIGLYLSKAFVEQHHGTIELESTLGKGSIFRAIFPIKSSENLLLPSNATDKMTVEIIGRPIGFDDDQDLEEKDAVELPILLIVEDDNDMNKFISTGLESEFNVVSAYNGREGLEQARKLLPDLIVSDVMMPEVNGFELIKQLRKDINTSHIPLLFLTAKTMKDDEIKGLKLGAVDYITKPFDLTTLRLKLKNILQTKHHMQEKLRTTMLLEPEEIELNSLDEAFLKDIVEAVAKNLDNPVFDVELLSNEVSMSSNQVYRKIKSLTGQTAKEFIRSQRLKTAASMLLQKKRTISEIIYMVGFSSPSYFARCFKEHFGCTPSEYIEKNA